jgi:predicted thioesterase
MVIWLWWMLVLSAFSRGAKAPTLVLSNLLHVGDSVVRSFLIKKDAMPPGHAGDKIATSYIIDRLEYAASTFMESKMSGNHSSVGYLVQFEHKEWPVVGSRLKVQATVEKVDARKAMFNVVITNDKSGAVIGSGIHGRAMIKYD